MNLFDLSEKVMVITGASNGIGRGLASYFSAQGVRLALIARNQNRADDLRKNLAANGESATVYALDVRDVTSIQSTFDRIANDFGRIDVLVNCAGMGKPINAIDVTPEDWEEMMSLNLRGSFFCAQAAARHMIPQKKGRIITISSQISVVANQGELVYCVSKGGINQMTRVLALEWGKEGVVTSAVAPTFTYTPGTAERLDTPAFRDAVLSKIPRGRLGEISDVAAAVHYLAGDSGDMANGSILFIDGGWTAV